MHQPVSSPLISVSDLQAHIADPGLFIIDVRFKLEDASYGALAYDEGHIPGALFMDLNKDLSAPVIAGVTGRHPLPDPAELSGKLQAAGLNSGHHVVAYDDGPGFYAARLWWLLRWLGHGNVSVLNGGLMAWRQAGGELVRPQDVKRTTGNFVGRPDNSLWVTAVDITNDSQPQRLLLLDARAAERYRGEVEPIDPVAGHIPGAVCLPCTANLDNRGLFLPPEQLRQRFPAPGPGQQWVCYCGSGVTACHNILAAVVAGLPMPLLYPGSWSEWITDPDHQIAMGENR